MEKAIVTAILTIGALAGAAAVITFGFSAGGSSQSVAEIDFDAKKSGIVVSAVSAKMGATTIEAWVKNVGLSPITALEKSDIFLIQPGNRLDAFIYDNDGLTSKTWYGDLTESALPWNRGDTLHITMTLSCAVKVLGNEDLLLRVVIPNGTTAEKIFESRWNGSCDYRQRLTVTTGAATPLGGYEGYTVRLAPFDTAALVAGGKLQADCDDLRVFWWNASTDIYFELDREVLSCDTAATEVRFRLQAGIVPSSSDDDYFVYYGNAGLPAGPSSLASIYLWHDSGATNQLGSYAVGRGDDWHGSGYTAFTYDGGFGAYRIDTGDNDTGSMRRQLNERDAYIEAEFYHTDCFPNNMTTGLAGRYLVNSGAGGSEESVHYYAANRAHQSSCGSGYSHDGDIMKNQRGAVVVNGVNPAAIARNQWRKQALALWSVNSTQGKFWDSDTLAGFGPPGWPAVGANASGADSAPGDMESPGAWGIIAAQDDVRVRNILIRRYTEPEPVVSSGAEEPL
ncbi:MAG: hypothetical protein BZY80_01755 [SAR202 cluster bacterium Io17-Chloro-G2]|nr:MAG: hypothetical protein BZY80_01755 [SAR202 cluster bacterium Io17-Chloro-G2]